MVNFLGVSDIIALIEAVGIEPMLLRMAEYIEDDFRRWSAFEKSSRVVNHSPEGVIELMPTSDGCLYAFKYVNGHPKNTARGLQTVAAFGVLSDVETGYPLIVSEMTLLTALRTAATSAIAAKHLARRESRSMAIIGLGAQSEFQALAFKAILQIERIRGYDIDPAAAHKFATNLTGAGITVEICASAQLAVADADIITTVTADKKRATILSDNMVGAGVHINAVGGDCPGKTEIQADILSRGTVFVEYPDQTRIEGEIQQMPADFPVTELWKVITGQAAGRVKRDQITIFDSVGFAIEDFSALRLLRDLAPRFQVGRSIDLIAAPADPRDLFGLIERAKTGSQAQVA